MSDQFDAAVLIGRFQPYHNGHAKLLEKALQLAPRVLVILGSSFQAKNSKNPFSWTEREAMIRATLDEAVQEKISFLPMRDYYDDKRWCQAVNALVAGAVQPKARVALIGFLKDASSQYLNRFPDWEYVSVPQYEELDATSVRKILYDSESWPATRALLSGIVPQEVMHYLKGWLHLPYFSRLKEEYLAVEENRRVWGNGPFVTADAVVTASNHILLVERGCMPGKGLWALPGGFLEPRERVLQCAVRELREETGFAILESSLEGALKGVAVFDHPDRSIRARTITHAHWFDLGDCHLPEVTGQDDAAKAQWVPISSLKEMEEVFFEDHFNILNHFLNLA